MQFNWIGFFNYHQTWIEEVTDRLAAQKGKDFHENIYYLYLNEVTGFAIPNEKKIWFVGHNHATEIKPTNYVIIPRKRLRIVVIQKEFKPKGYKSKWERPSYFDLGESKRRIPDSIKQLGNKRSLAKYLYREAGHTLDQYGQPTLKTNSIEEIDRQQQLIELPNEIIFVTDQIEFQGTPIELLPTGLWK